MVLVALVEQLLRIQNRVADLRVQIAKMTKIPGIEKIVREITNLEIQLATELAKALGATPMALGGLVSEPTFALVGESGPELVIPVNSDSKPKRKVSKYQKMFGKQLKIVKKTSRLKNGSYRSGWNQAKEFNKAHKMTRKMMK